MVVPAELREVADRARPVTLARERTLPVTEALAGLLPDGALTRGTVVGAGAPAPPPWPWPWRPVRPGPARGWWRWGSRSWAWPRRPSSGWTPTAWPWSRLRRPGRGGRWWPRSSVAVDVILVDGRAPVRSGEGRRLAARARERGSVLVPVLPGPARVRRAGEWPHDVRLRAGSGTWEGLGEGHGHLRRRRLVVVAEGRGRAARPRRAELWLPGPDGAPAPVDPDRRVVALRSVG